MFKTKTTTTHYYGPCENKPTKPHYIVDKSKTKKYGYTIRDINALTSYFKGPECTGGWYKKKTDAQHRADILNDIVRETAL